MKYIHTWHSVTFLQPLPHHTWKQGPLVVCELAALPEEVFAKRCWCLVVLLQVHLVRVCIDLTHPLQLVVVVFTKRVENPDSHPLLQHLEDLLAKAQLPLFFLIINNPRTELNANIPLSPEFFWNISTSKQSSRPVDKVNLPQFLAIVFPQKSLYVPSVLSWPTTGAVLYDRHLEMLHKWSLILWKGWSQSCHDHVGDPEDDGDDNDVHLGLLDEVILEHLVRQGAGWYCVGKC